MKLSAVIITNRLEINPLLLKSIAFADEIVIVIDSPSVIPTRLPAGRAPTRNPTLTPPTKIFFRPLNHDFASQRNFALEKAKSDWVLFVDDDEYVGSELAGEIISAIKNKKFIGYLLHRQDVVFHQPLFHGETGNLRILRLAKRTAGKFQRSVHEVWKVSGRVGELSSPLYHNKDHFVSEFIGRILHYGQIDSQMLTAEGKPFSWFRLLINPLAKYKFNYLFKAGFLDGTAGLFQAYLMGVQSLSVRVFQWENRN